MSSPAMMSNVELHPDKGAVMTLFAMGIPNSSAAAQAHQSCQAVSISASPPITDCQELHFVEDDQSRASDCNSITGDCKASKGKLPMKKRTVVKHKDPKVSFEEMKRLMRVYGPTKCLRNRTPKESGKSTKVLSVKRKFYRWFPDFHIRFALQAGGWYKPKIGHEEEMKYREDLRNKDQGILAAKRNVKKMLYLY